ncbi:MAG TPA: glycosyltransferase, partial [Rhodopila sp.]
MAAFPGGRADAAGIVSGAAIAAQRFGAAWKSLAPLWDVGDFCLAVRRAVADAIGPADEAYGLGPCWEMDYAIRAVRAGFIAVWAQGSYVYRHPFTARRQRHETLCIEASRRRYQDKFCGLRRSGERTSYALHCRGEVCKHFAPTASAPFPQPRTEPPAEVATTGGWPLVSCIMPTSGRPDWVPQAIHYFQQQDYPNLELIIVDTSPAGVTPNIPDDPRIRYHRLASRRPIGSMRNIAVEQARGDIIIHWDDDDWYAPNRVSAQVQPILDDVADITGLHDTRFFDLDTWRFWRCSTDFHQRLFVLDVHGGTLAFRRSVFGATCRYPDLSLAEDAWFLQHAVWRGARLARVPGAELFLYLRHASNAWAFRCGTYLDPKGWLEVSEPKVMGRDRAFYVPRSPAGVRAARPALPPTIADAAGRIAIGVHVHAEPVRFHATIAALNVHTPPGFTLLVLPDGPDAATRAALAALPGIAQSSSEAPLGAPACFNRLAAGTDADTLILLESGTIVSAGWLEKLLTALTADETNGLASPSTNRAWNQLGIFANRGEADIARTAADAERMFGSGWRSLE